MSAGHRNKHNTHFSGNNGNQLIHDVAVILKNKFSTSCIHFIPYSKSVILVQIKITVKNLNLIHIFATTANKYDKEV